MEAREPKKYYSAKIEQLNREITALKKKMNAVSALRLVVIVAMVAHLALVKEQTLAYYGGAALLYLVPFTLLVVYHNRLAKQRRYAEDFRVLCEGEMGALSYDFSAFDGAANLSDPKHPYSVDLDLFGEKSLFQSLNRTVTPDGKTTLANYLLTPLTNSAEIVERQQAVEELKQNPQLRQHFYVTGIAQPKTGGDKSIVSTLTSEVEKFTSNPIWRLLTWAVPIAWVAIFVAWALGAVNYVVPALYFVVSSAIAYSKIREVNTTHASLDKMHKTVAQYAELMKIIESNHHRSEPLMEIGERLSSNGERASKAVEKLSKILTTLDQRGSMGGAVLNIFTIREIRALIELGDWKRQNREAVGDWFDALGEFDALCSLATLGFNNPHYPFPTIVDNYFTMQGTALGHPLMERTLCIPNDIEIAKNPYFLIITGANMAGKSTYLRTVGVNFVLALAGAPVCAEALTLSPATLMTSLRTTDSLMENESYFYAELKRLKAIIDRLNSGEKMFILLDEILKGTNSEDKRRGSLALVRQFIRHNTCGIIATHDLVLGSLEEELPESVRNFRFEADIEDSKLSFSYKLQQGVAQNLNAYFLMKKMGITL